MSKVTDWTKNTRFISIERAGNSLSELCKVANGSLQLNIRQHIMYVWNVTVSNFRPRLLAAWKLLMRLEKVSHTGASLPFIYNDATQSLFQQEATLSIFCCCCSFVGLFLLNLLIQGCQIDIPGDCCFLLVPVQMKAASRSSVFSGFLGDFRFP